MPYKGSKIVPIRMPDAKLKRVQDIIARSVHFRRAEPYTMSSFLMAALDAKLDHMERSRGKRRRKQQVAA